MPASTATEAPGQLDSLRELLRQRFPGAVPLEGTAPGALASGLAPLDSLLQGGLPLGALSLLCGSASCGKTGLALAFAAELTQQGGRLAWVHQGSFSSPSARHAGVDLEALLSVRVDSFEQARRCADFLLRWQAFHLVVLDWPGRGGPGKAWSRLQRLVTDSEGALLVLSPPLPKADPLRYCASLILAVERDLPSSSLSLCLSKSRFGPAGSGSLPWAREQGDLLLIPELPGLGQSWHDEVG